jgi:hypothetical protein
VICRYHKYIIKEFLCSLSENGENIYEIFWTKPESFHSNAWGLCNQVYFSLANKYCFTVFMISWWFTVGVDLPLECLCYVEMGSFLDVLEVHAASIFMAELCRVGEFLCLWRCLFGNWGRELGVWEWWTLGWVTAWEHQLPMIFFGAFIKIVT